MLFKTLAGIGLFAAGGAAVGYSQILCFNGECAITGTAYGGAFFGGMLGFAVMSGLNTPAVRMPVDTEPSEPIEPNADDSDRPDAD